MCSSRTRPCRTVSGVLDFERGRPPSGPPTARPPLTACPACSTGVAVALSASYDGTAFIWDLQPGRGAEPLHTLRVPQLDDNNEFVEGRWAADGTSLALCDVSGRLVLYGAALGSVGADAQRGEPLVGGATALTLESADDAAAPHEQVSAPSYCTPPPG